MASVYNQAVLTLTAVVTADSSGAGAERFLLVGLVMLSMEHARSLGTRLFVVAGGVQSEVVLLMEKGVMASFRQPTEVTEAFTCGRHGGSLFPARGTCASYAKATSTGSVPT